eukprot:Pompholyxophrys_punicea_v1_NODE_1478_length_693_cov_2.564263.p1 type:complete len:114 gc:universal NODE_1478_length_693_cov_2.564263:204-545(+)
MQIGCSLAIPAFLDGRSQLSNSEITEMRRIANLRIHVERAIGRLKRFRILHSMRRHLPGSVNIIPGVCVYLSNFEAPLEWQESTQSASCIMHQLGSNEKSRSANTRSPSSNKS